MIDLAIHRTVDDLDGTAYVELGPGRYTGRHWQSGFVFLTEDAFAFAEGILSRHLPEYDHYGMNDVPRSIGLTVAAEWRFAATGVSRSRDSDRHTLLNLDDAYRSGLREYIDEHREDIAQLLAALADEFETVYSGSDWACVLGL